MKIRINRMFCTEIREIKGKMMICVPNAKSQLHWITLDDFFKSEVYSNTFETMLIENKEE